MRHITPEELLRPGLKPGDVVRVQRLSHDKYAVLVDGELRHMSRMTARALYAALDRVLSDPSPNAVFCAPARSLAPEES